MKKITDLNEMKALVEAQLIEEFQRWIEPTEKDRYNPDEKTSPLKEYVQRLIERILSAHLGVQKNWNRWDVRIDTKLQKKILEQADIEAMKFVDKVDLVKLSDREMALIEKEIHRAYVDALRHSAGEVASQKARADIYKYVNDLGGVQIEDEGD